MGYFFVDGLPRRRLFRYEKKYEKKASTIRVKCRIPSGTSGLHSTTVTERPDTSARMWPWLEPASKQPRVLETVTEQFDGNRGTHSRVAKIGRIQTEIMPTRVKRKLGPLNPHYYHRPGIIV